jgi:outer membrane assembly lipoprotein YfiO
VRLAARRWTILLLASALAGAGLSCASAKKPPKDKFVGMTAEQIYRIGLDQIEKKKYGKARSTLQAALGRPTSTQEVIAGVHLALADAYFHDGGLLNLAEALSRYTNFLTFYPKHERADYVQYQLGVCHLRQTLSADRDQTQTRKALDEFLKVSATYPNSPYVGPAETKANEARERLAEAEFRVGRYYHRTGAHQGAIDRFREILEKYPLYSRKDRLYLMLGRSLMALQRADEGRVYLEKLVAEYPRSRHALEARALLGIAQEGAEGGS